MRKLLSLCAAGLAAVAAAPLPAGVLTGQSDAHGVAVDLDASLLPIFGGPTLSAGVGPLPVSSGSAPVPYADADQALSVNFTAGSFGFGNNVLSLTTGLLSTTASSTVDGGLGARAASATSTVNNLSLGGVTTPLLPFLPDLVRVTATSIQTASTVSGDFGALVAEGTMIVENLVITVLGVNVATINGAIAANTGIDVSSVLGGITVLLNEQVTTGDGVGSLGLTTNAIRISLADVGLAGIGTIDGDIIVGHTEASLTAAADPTPAVPEPGTLALALGAAGIGLVRGGWRRSVRRSRAA